MTPGHPPSFSSSHSHHHPARSSLTMGPPRRGQQSTQIQHSPKVSMSAHHPSQAHNVTPSASISAASPAPGLGMSPAMRYEHNLKVLRRRDPSITRIFDQWSHVTVYIWNASTESWANEKPEGPMFLFERSEYPPYGFYILNRMGMEDYIVRMHPEDESAVQEGKYILYMTFPEFSEKRDKVMLEDKFDPRMGWNAPFRIPGKGAEGEDERGKAHRIMLWVYNVEDQREPLTDVLFRLREYVRRNQPYPSQFQFGPERLGLPLTTPMPSPMVSRAQAQTHVAKARSRGISNASHPINGTDPPANSVSSNGIPIDPASQSVTASTKINLHSLFATAPSASASASASPSATTSTPTSASSNSNGQKLLASIFASATASSIAPDHASQPTVDSYLTSSSIAPVLPTSNTALGTLFASAMTPGAQPISSQPTAGPTPQTHSSQMTLDALFASASTTPMFNNLPTSQQQEPPQRAQTPRRSAHEMNTTFKFPSPEQRRTVSHPAQATLYATHAIATNPLAKPPTPLSRPVTAAPTIAPNSTAINGRPRHTNMPSQEDADQPVFGASVGPSRVPSVQPAPDPSQQQQVLSTGLLATLMAGGATTPYAATPPPIHNGAVPQGRQAAYAGQYNGTHSSTGSVAMHDTVPNTSNGLVADLMNNRANGASAVPGSARSSSTPRPAAATTMFSSASAWDQTDNAINGHGADSDIVELDFSDTSALSDMNKFKALVAAHSTSASASPQSTTKTMATGTAHANGKQSVKGAALQDVTSTPSSQLLDVSAIVAEDATEKKKKSKREKERERRERRKVERANEVAATATTPSSVSAAGMEPSSSSDAVVYMTKDKPSSGEPGQDYDDEPLDRPSTKVALLRAVARAPQAGMHLKGLGRNDFVKEVLTLIHTDKAFVDDLWQEYMSMLE